MATRLFVNFSDIQRHSIDNVGIWHKNSNSFEQLCMSSLPAKIKKIQSKKKAPEWPKHIPNCRSIGLFQMLKGS